VKDERVRVLDSHELRERRHLLFHVDVRKTVVSEDTELAAETEVDTGRLEVALLPRLDDETPGFDLFTDATVAED
jgi:hypothetical protein